MRRSEVIELVTLVLEEPAMRREALRRARAWVTSNRAASSDLRQTALVVGVQDGGAEIFDAIVRRLETETDGFERRRMLAAIGSARDPALAARARDLALSNTVRANEVLRAVGASFRVESQRDAAFEWMKERYSALVVRLPSSHASELPRLTATFCDEARVASVGEFFATRVRDLPGGPRNLDGTLEQIHLCAARVERQREAVARWVAAR
jgi:alanyl aminopeptidase